MGHKIVADLEAPTLYQANDDLQITLAAYELAHRELIKAKDEANFNLVEELKKPPAERSTEPFINFAIADSAFNSFKRNLKDYQEQTQK